MTRSTQLFVDKETRDKLNAKVAKLLEDDGFKKSFPEIASAHHELAITFQLEGEEAPIKAQKKLAFEKLDKAIEISKKQTSAWQILRKAKLSALSKYVAIQKQKQLPNEYYKSIYQKATDDLIQGPRMMNDATLELQKVVQGLLDPTKSPSCHYNDKNELIISIDDEEYNMTDILNFKPDFDQLRFSKTELLQYQAYQTQVGLPMIEVQLGNGRTTDKPATEENYDPNDPQSAHLTYPEKLAITLYSGGMYDKMQDFLRKSAMKTESFPSDEMRMARVKQLVLAIGIASHSLSKPLSIDYDANAPDPYALDPTDPSKPPPSPPPPAPGTPDPNSYEVLERGEKSNAAVNKRREQDFKDNKVTPNPGFISTTSDKKVANFFSATSKGKSRLMFIQPIRAMGRKIHQLANIRNEKETLYGPGTEYKVVEFARSGKSTQAVAVPVRSLDNASHPNAYTRFKFNKKLDEIKKRMDGLDKKMKRMKSPDSINECKSELEALKQSWDKEKNRMNSWLDNRYKRGEMVLKLEPEDASIQSKMGNLDRQCSAVFEKAEKLSKNISLKASLK